ncbi:MAG: HAD family hydrolase [Candidatus Heimdallarchaeota archaeon]|nr:HAD family hydrolase [Candidatus Heimdallarchaeota archaeon]
MTDSMETPLKAILFDFDGTLVDTKSYYFGLVAKFLGNDPEETISLAGKIISSRLSPKDNNIKWELLKASYIISRKLGYGYIRSIRAVMFLIRNHSKFFSKAQPTLNTVEGLEELRLKGIKMGIISFSSREKIERFIDNYLPKRVYFPDDSILAAGEFGKTKEAGIITFLENLNLTEKPYLCAIVGDLGGDIIAGNNVKLFTIGITTGYASEETLRKASPSLIAYSLSDIAHRVEKSD